MSTEGNGGIYSKFQERLRKIRLSRIRRKQQNDKFIQDRVQDIRKTIQKDTTPGYRASIAPQPKEKDDSLSEVIIDIRKTTKDREYVKNKVGVSKDEVNSNITIEKNNNIDSKIIDIRKNKPKIRRAKRYISDIKKENITNKEKEELLREMGADIVDKIKESFEDKLDELEVLSSELYLLNQQQNNELELKKVEGLKKRINELIKKVNELIDQYNLYKKNYYIDNVIDIDDTIIVDDIINYRYLLDSLDGEKKFVKEYKALEEFKSLYNNLKEVRDETEKLVYSNEEKIEEYEIRDKKYDNIKLGMLSASDTYKKCSSEIEKQNKYFKDLMDKVTTINSKEYTTNHLRGIGNLVNQSLKYMGLMLLSPLVGFVPGIAMQTIATKKMIGNIYKHMHIEEIRHIHYEAINYDSEINHHLCDVSYTENLIDDTLKDVERLKEDFMMIYNSNIPGYDDTLKNIQKIENKLLHNQNKISIVKRNLKNSKKLNEDKLKKVRQLNNIKE